MTCERRLWNDPDGLRCGETGEHTTHVYVASAGPDLDTPGHHADGSEQ